MTARNCPTLAIDTESTVLILIIDIEKRQVYRGSHYAHAQVLLIVVYYFTSFLCNFNITDSERNAPCILRVLQ